jgi:hypothetical protein
MLLSLSKTWLVRNRENRSRKGWHDQAMADRYDLAMLADPCRKPYLVLVDFVSIQVIYHPEGNNLYEADFHSDAMIFNLSLVQTHASLG